MQTHPLNFDILPNSAFIRQKQLIGTIYPKSATSLWRDVRDGKFPKPIKLSPQCAAWRVSDIREWQNSLK